MSDYTEQANDQSRFPWGWVTMGVLGLLAATGALPNLRDGIADAFHWAVADHGMRPLIWATDCVTVWVQQSFAVPEAERPAQLTHWAALWAINITLIALAVQRGRARRSAKRTPAGPGLVARRRGSLTPAQLSLAEQQALVNELAALALERTRATGPTP